MYTWKGKFCEKDYFNGDPMFLHHMIKTKPLDMASMESYSQQELGAICRECKIDKIAKLSKVPPFLPLTCSYIPLNFYC